MKKSPAKKAKTVAERIAAVLKPYKIKADDCGLVGDDDCPECRMILVKDLELLFQKEVPHAR